MQGKPITLVDCLTKVICGSPLRDMFLPLRQAVKFKLQSMPSDELVARRQALEEKRRRTTLS